MPKSNTITTIQLSFPIPDDSDNCDNFEFGPDSVEILELSLEEYKKLLAQAMEIKKGGDLYASLSYFDRAIASVPDNEFATDALYEKALTLSLLGFYHEAKAIFSMLIDMDNFNETYHYHLGLCNLALGMYQSALSALRDAFQYGEESEELKAHLIFAFQQTGIWDEAKALMEEVK